MSDSINPTTTPAPVNTCQICGRPIKANTGTIAHHGYKRPGGGWQTASCMGAKYLPYEQSCDRIQYVIDIVKSHLAATERALEAFIANPPEKLTTKKHGRTEIIVERPEGFTLQFHRTYQPYAYDTLFFARKYEMEQDIARSHNDVEYLSKRLADWKAPELAVSR